ncbi:hypothetical protein [Natronosalvus halobius]|uniref:hypothetical protein n=1 Tax=Natronosalvus halobius TaxID=2953746 RepID=UPI00209DF5E5|nr:hypothetical protein [Natronosalvus halobius]USZ70682.1 hypothetical protein NGM15_11265 [Natronosalvus halobius]
MVSRESRVLLGSMALVAAVILGLDLVTNALGLPRWSSPLFGFLVIVGLGVAVPQLYLARTDDERSPLTRLRIVVFLTVVFAFLFVGGAQGLERQAIAGLTALTVVGWFGYEFLVAYRAAKEDPSRLPDVDGGPGGP